LLHSRSSLSGSTQVADFQIVSQSNKTNAFGDVVHVLMVNIMRAALTRFGIPRMTPKLTRIFALFRPCC
jgi:hypothetical protein